MTKLNKQGVRDLGHAPKTIPTPKVDIRDLDPWDDRKNHLPGEMAAKLLSEQPAEFGAPLDPLVQEFLTILAEECGEVVQRVTKILRFGLRRNPLDGKDNVERLEAEIGDICAVLEVLLYLAVIDEHRVDHYIERKLRAFAVEENPAKPRIRHMSETLRNLIVRGLL